MKVNPFLVPLIVVVVFIGSVLTTQASGFWSTSGRTSVNVEKMVPADLKGWMTLQQVIDGTGVSKTDLYDLVKIPTDVPTSTALKDIEKLVPGFETSTLRDALTKKLAAPTTLQSK
jgi:hypothetical protein